MARSVTERMSPAEWLRRRLSAAAEPAEPLDPTAAAISAIAAAAPDAYSTLLTFFSLKAASCYRLAAQSKDARESAKQLGAGAGFDDLVELWRAAPQTAGRMGEENDGA